jgi:exodeoxyribonuclease VII small subunit
MSEMSKEMNFEESLKRLEQLVERLEAGDLPLEESLKIFEEGRKLAEICNQKLESAVLRVEQLTADGEMVEIDVQ